MKRVIALLLSVLTVFGISFACSASTVIFGDCNQDGDLDVCDAVYSARVSNKVASPGTVELERGDVNKDGKIDSKDTVSVRKMILDGVKYGDNVYVAD